MRRLLTPSQPTVAGSIVGDGTVEWFVELAKQIVDLASRHRVALNLSIPAAARGVISQFQLESAASTQARRICRSGDEFGARQIQVALARTFFGQPQTVPELERRLEEVGLYPIDCT